MNRLAITLFLAAALLTGCSRHGSDATSGECEQVNSIYYWKTTFSLSEKDVAFMRKHDIGRIYLRMFDVDLDKNWGQDSIEVVPVATTKFLSSVPAGVEIVPTVFITKDAIYRSASDMDHLADLIVRRVLAMASYNELGTIREVQYDCDWTNWSERAFFSLCERSKALLAENDICLSGTVRLHQLANKSLPFDKGVLMMYNVGAIKKYGTENSILNVEDVSAYLSGTRLEEFRKMRRRDGFCMDVAYPVYGWGVAFRDKKFLCLLHESDFSDENLYERVGEFMVKVKKDILVDGNQLVAGDEIRVEIPDMRLIRKTKQMVESALEGMSQGNLIYYLDDKSLSRFTEDEIDEIYS